MPVGLGGPCVRSQPSTAAPAANAASSASGIAPLKRFLLI